MDQPLHVRASRPFRRSIQELKLDRRPLEILQVNVGKHCNQACLHCHVEAGPKRPERMAPATVERVLELLARSPSVTRVDITGGAPELNPCFRRLVSGARDLGRQVMDRCNLTVLLEEGQEDTPSFLASHGVQVTASLPCYSRENVDRQRGSGVFERSLEGLRRLNAVGYGRSLELNLVYNPGGPFLPPPQERLEADFRQRLREDFGIEFTRLFTLANMPIRRFLFDLQRSGRLAEYVDLLVRSFNPAAAEGVMCRDLVSVGWDGRLWDCDFNQMVELPLGAGFRTIWDLESLSALSSGPIAFADHCYGCTAGAGSSCTGSLT